MSEQTEFMSVKEFRALGFLQELNRQFLHPLGLAIEVQTNDETGEESFGRVWDCREDPEGISYADSVLADPDFQEKRQRIESLQAKAKLNNQ